MDAHALGSSGQPFGGSGITPGSLATQCLELGLIDELSISLVPALLGSGVRLFNERTAPPVILDGPDQIVEVRMTHLRYRVCRA